MRSLVILALAFGCRTPGLADSIVWDGTDTGPDGDTGGPDRVCGENVRVDWDGVDTDGVAWIEVCDELSFETFYLGIAETASDDGWYGEDCLGDHACHRFSATPAILSFVERPEDVVAGSTTLFDGGWDGVGDAVSQGDWEERLTYVVGIAGGESGDRCFVWGHDVEYYAEYECEPP